MIQRIQSVYLLIISILGVCLWFFPIASITHDIHVYNITTWGIQLTESNQTIYQFIPYLFLVLLLPIISFSSIFIYKKRILQMRLNVIAMILMIFLYGIIYFYIDFATTIISKNSIIDYKLPIIIPVINLILCYLAIRAIGKDEALIRSLSRIR
ncbi:MAG: DUF4293 domain-containing protein [Paludibacteraceae bacterium]|nr:DUF4293 domain-containing protein [Paludibacteraceae bacterium]